MKATGLLKGKYLQETKGYFCLPCPPCSDHSRTISRCWRAPVALRERQPSSFDHSCYRGTALAFSRAHVLRNSCYFCTDAGGGHRVFSAVCSLLMKNSNSWMALNKRTRSSEAGLLSSVTRHQTTFYFDLAAVSPLQRESGRNQTLSSTHMGLANPE